MAPIVVDAMTAVQWIPTIASATLAPTVAEWNAGTKLDLVLITAGLEGFDPSSAEIDTTSLGSPDDTKLPGRTSYSNTALVAMKQTATDTVYAVLSVPNTAGFIGIRDGVAAATAVAAAQVIDVYPVKTGRTGKVGRGENGSALRYRTPCTVTSAVGFDKAVLA